MASDGPDEPDDPDGPDDLGAALRRLPAGWHAHLFAVTDSTQDEARAAARAGAPDRSLFIADYQRAGRGSHGRTWLARPGTALLVSVLFREPLPWRAPLPWRSTALACLAMAEAIQALEPRLVADIKWPNDLLLGGRKVAGVLAESSWDGRQATVIVGTGVNVSTPADELARIGRPATSLQIACDQVVDRGELLLAFVHQLDVLRGQAPAELQRRWQARLWGRGQRLRLVEHGQELEVVVLGADPDGALRVRLADGRERTTLTGELLL